MKKLFPTTSPYLFTYLCIAYIGGIAFSSSYPYPYAPSNSSLLLLFSVLLLLAYIAHRRNILFLGIMLPYLILLGMYHGSLSSRLPQARADIYNQIQLPADIVLIGHLQSMPSEHKNSTVITLSCRYFRTQKQHLTPCQGNVQLRMRFPWPVEYPPGTLLAIRTVVKKPDMFRNIGSFNYPAYLARKNIQVTGYIRSPAQIAPISQEPSLLQKIHYLPEQIRMKTGIFLDTRLTNLKQKALYRALLLGDRSHISNQLYEQYKASGVAHILSISGMHLTLIGVFLYLFLYWILRRSEYIMLTFPVRKTAIILSLPPLICYTFLAGLGSPAMRACIMAVVVGLAFCTDRIQSTVNLLSFAAVFLLLFSPQKLFTVSFQLSFVAVACITLTAPFIRKVYDSSCQNDCSRIRKILFALRKWGITGFFISLSATLGTAPLTIYHFNRFPLAGPVANLVIEPLICLFALPLGILSLPFMEIYPGLSVFLLDTGGHALSLANTITYWIASIPHSNLWLPQPTFAHIFCYYSLLLLLPHFIVRGGHGRLLLPSLFAITLLLLLVPGLLKPADERQRPGITVLDVGQGSATLIQSDSGKAILIDGGGSATLSPSVGERIIAPYLWKMGITKLHGIIITHPDADHYNGLPFLIRHFSPQILWTSSLQENEAGYRKLLQLCRKSSIPVHLARQSDTIEIDNTKISCLANTRHSPYSNNDSNSGLVLQVHMDDLSILFPGDIEKEVEQQLVDNHIPLHSDILLAAHHGSATSNSGEFVDAVSPLAIIVSAGKSRRKIYPSEGLLFMSRKNRIPLYSTHTDGAIWVQSEKGGYELYRFGALQENPLLRLTNEGRAEQFFD